MVTFLLEFFYIYFDKHQTLHNFREGIKIIIIIIIIIIIKDREGEKILCEVCCSSRRMPSFGI
jgi:hypothetical protein